MLLESLESYFFFELTSDLLDLLFWQLGRLRSETKKKWETRNMGFIGDLGRLGLVNPILLLVKT